MKFQYALTAALFATVPLFAEPVSGIAAAASKVQVSSTVPMEIIKEMLVEEGTKVTKDQVIVLLRNDREKMDVRISEKAIQLKQFIAFGHERLYKEKMGSEEKALEARTDLELTKIQFEAKQLALDEKTIRSPINGIVVKKYKQTGEMATQQTPLLDIIDIDSVEVLFNLDVSARLSVKEGNEVRVKVTDLAPRNRPAASAPDPKKYEEFIGVEFTGKVSFVDPRNDAASGTLKVKVKIENKDHQIKDGMKCVAEFEK
jgi:membrane fusion protein, multidrug efflux system